MSILEIEQAIAKLPSIQRADLLARLQLDELRSGITEAVEAAQNGRSEAWDASEIEAIKKEGRERLAALRTDV